MDAFLQLLRSHFLFLLGQHLNYWCSRAVLHALLLPLVALHISLSQDIAIHLLGIDSLMLRDADTWVTPVGMAATVWGFSGLSFILSPGQRGLPVPVAMHRPTPHPLS